jgi:hypothetical protein
MLTFTSLAKTLDPSEAQRHEGLKRPQAEQYHVEIGFSAVKQL